MKKKPPPTVTVTKVRDRQVTIKCCYCGKPHWHGWPVGDAKIGYRVAHCRTGPSRTYYIAAPEEEDQAR